jgi:hypothetical protein
MGSPLFEDVKVVLGAAGDAPIVAGVRKAVRLCGHGFTATPEAFEFLIAVGDDSPPREQKLWTAVRVFGTFGPGSGRGPPDEKRWDVHSCRTQNLPPGMVAVPPEDDFGRSLERLAPERVGGPPMRLAQVHRLLMRESASPFIRIVVGGALTIYVSLTPFVVVGADVEFTVPSVEMVGLHWSAH